MQDIEERMRKQLVRFLVQRNITCPATGEVLDMDTCVVLVDSDGDPKAVLSQAGWAAMDDAHKAKLAAMDCTVDPATVKA